MTDSAMQSEPAGAAPDAAEGGSPGGPSAGSSSTPSINYSRSRQREDKAASYNVKYEQEWHKRVSDRKEKRLLEAILRRMGKVSSMLDVPCGAGRLAGVMAPFAERHVKADYSAPMLDFCRSNAQGYVPRVANVSAFELPFLDRSVDAVLCIRLNHHVPQRADRLRLIDELCRVSRRFVLTTFFDESSFKNRLREWRKRRGGKKSKKSLSREEVAERAAAAGYRVVGQWRLSSLFSGHTFALLERTE